MNIKVVDVKILSKYHSGYQAGIQKISETKGEFIKRLEPFKNQMTQMITESIKITDESLIKENAEKFQELQDQALQIDHEFKKTMKEMNDELSKEIYTDLESIISEWSSSNSVDMVVSNTEVIYLNPKHFVTDEIIEILKEKELYINLEE